MIIHTVPMGAAACRPGKRGTDDNGYLTHAVEFDSKGEPIRLLCDKAKLEHLCWDAALYDKDPANCKVCARRMVTLKQPATLAKVNAAIEAARVLAELVRDSSGYHYFVGADIPSGVSAGIYVYRTADKTMEEWIDEARALKAAKDAAKAAEPIHRLVLRP